jgi:hypothetical protein
VDLTCVGYFKKNQNSWDMKIKLLKQLALGGAALVVAVLNVSAQDQNVPGNISGQISFVGGATLDGPLATATAFTSFFGPSGVGNPVVLAGSQTGDYASVAGGTPASFTIFTFNPPPGGGVNPLWTFTIGPTTYSFVATSVAVAFQNPMFLNIQGSGTASITGFTDTGGTWTITDSGIGSQPVFTFGANTTVVGVPEPSALALLLAFAPIALAFRPKAKSKV